jgi:hypothetical protein
MKVSQEVHCRFHVVGQLPEGSLMILQCDLGITTVMNELRVKTTTGTNNLRSPLVHLELNRDTIRTSASTYRTIHKQIRLRRIEQDDLQYTGAGMDTLRVARAYT